MPENPFWSVIVATYQRGKVLFDSIEYILALSYPHFAFLVIDQTPQHEADTEQFIRACKTKYAERFRWHFGARVNLQNARNVGAKMARGEYLLFCDDVIVPPANLIELHSRNLMEPGEGAATFGVYVERKKLPPQPRTCVILPYGPMLDFWENDVPKGTTDSLRDGNMSMSRKFAFEVGLFDDAYIGRSNGTETNLSLRILRKGYQIAYDPDTAVVHLGHKEGGAHVSRDISEGRYFLERHHNNAYFFAKNFQQRYLPRFLKRELGWILVKQAIFQKHPERIIPSLRGLWSGYWAGLRSRKILDPL